MQQKIKDVERWALEAYANAMNGQKYNALNDARKAGEAICKLVIFKELGDDVGEVFIYGVITVNLRMPSDPTPLTFNALISAIVNPQIDAASKFQDKKLKQQLDSLRIYGNKGSHDINNIDENDITFADVVNCMLSLSDVISYVFVVYLGQEIPPNLKIYVIKTASDYFLEIKNKLPHIRRKRLENLEKLLDKNYQLISEWELKKMTNTDPTYLLNCEAELGRLKNLAEETEQEYNDLLAIIK